MNIPIIPFFQIGEVELSNLENFHIISAWLGFVTFLLVGFSILTASILQPKAYDEHELSYLQTKKQGIKIGGGICLFSLLFLIFGGYLWLIVMLVFGVLLLAGIGYILYQAVKILRS